MRAIDTSSVFHVKKRPLSGISRKLAQEKLEFMKATNFKTKKANDLMDQSDCIPATLHSSPVYRKARQEIIDKTYTWISFRVNL